MKNFDRRGLGGGARWIRTPGAVRCAGHYKGWRNGWFLTLNFPAAQQITSSANVRRDSGCEDSVWGR